MKLRYSKTVKDKYGAYIDVDIINYEETNVVEIDTYNYDVDNFKPTFGIDEIDELIEILKEAREVLARGRDTNE